MCRWFIYFGNKIIIKNILYDHNNSIIKQSYKNKYTPFLENIRDHEVNVDGFGIGWFHNKNNIITYKSTKTPYTDFNFKNISKILKSNLIFAHIRAIKPFSSNIVHELNCHPFNYKNLLFMHNGDIKNFLKIKVEIIKKINKIYLNEIKGTTDSEYIFYLILSFIEKKNLDDIQKSIIETINFLNSLKNIGIYSFNIAITNGKFVIFTRYINNENDTPPSLYFKNDIVNILISSEPIDYNDNWNIVPKNNIGIYNNNLLSLKKI